MAFYLLTFIHLNKKKLCYKEALEELSESRKCGLRTSIQWSGSNSIHTTNGDLVLSIINDFRKESFRHEHPICVCKWFLWHQPENVQS